MSTSSLLLQDAGVYSCSVPQTNDNEFPRAKVHVHVIYGEP